MAAGRSNVHGVFEYLVDEFIARVSGIKWILTLI